MEDSPLSYGSLFAELRSLVSNAAQARRLCELESGSDQNPKAPPPPPPLFWF